MFTSALNQAGTKLYETHNWIVSGSGIIHAMWYYHLPAVQKTKEDKIKLTRAMEQPWFMYSTLAAADACAFFSCVSKASKSWELHPRMETSNCPDAVVPSREVTPPPQAVNSSLDISLYLYCRSKPLGGGEGDNYRVGK